MPTNTFTVRGGAGSVSQIHTFSGGADNQRDDVQNLDFDWISEFSHGHHARGGGGNDTFNFTNIHRVGSTVVGRLEDFDSRSDVIQIDGTPVDLSNPPENVRIVAFNGDHNDPDTSPQQWMLIDTGGGFIFYALHGARVDMNGNGGANFDPLTGVFDQESHFIRIQDVPDFSQLTDVAFSDPQNYVPAGLVPTDGGRIIHDDDENRSDVLAPVMGSMGGDLISAGLNDDVVYAQSGDDTIWGGTGDDTLFGADGADVFYGGLGDEVIIGGRGDDRAYGGAGSDKLSGWGGDDALYGNEGNDRLYGNQGNDQIYAGFGNDTVWGGTGADSIFGGGGRDRLNGGGGNDHIVGNMGADSLIGGTGHDTLNGGRGNDKLLGGSGADMLTGGHGRDVFIFQRNDLVDWDNLTGSCAERLAQIDLVTDFNPEVDTIDLSSVENVDGLSDLRLWRTMVDDDLHFSLMVRDSNERILVNVTEETTWSKIVESDCFIF